ncbi:MAG: hypothetical protein HYY54_01605 [candidate division NC10 bacterium]|nr:hypothetical protein [candidate division NC10 bacterium]
MGELQYVEWHPPSELQRQQEEEARRRSETARRRQRVLLAAVLLAAGAGTAILWWASVRREEGAARLAGGPASPGGAPALSGPVPPSSGGPAPISPVERSLELWYALTRSAAVGEAQIQATLQTPALVALRATALGKGADWSERFDHGRYLYVEVRVGTMRGALREAFLADPAGSLVLVDDAGARVRGTVPDALQDEAVALTRDEGVKGVTGAAFLAAFPRADLSPTTRFLRLEVANLAGVRRPGLTWEVTPGTGEAVLREPRS